MPARILIIEDNSANLELMSYLLRAFEHDALTARDGEEGLHAALSGNYDLIICDVELPKINGLEIARRLKSNANARQTPLIAVTAFAMVGDRDRTLAAGFDGYIPKPIAPEKFVGEVEEFLPVVKRSTPRTTTRKAVEISKPERTRASILVVDNHPVNVDLMRSLLEPSGYYLFSSNSVDDALEMAHLTTVDLIISDVHMPNKDGYTFIQAVKSDASLRNIPFMFLSSTQRPEDEPRRAAAFGADRFIVRPIEPRLLLAEIEDLISNEQAKDTITAQ